MTNRCLIACLLSAALGFVAALGTAYFNNADLFTSQLPTIEDGLYDVRLLQKTQDEKGQTVFWVFAGKMSLGLRGSKKVDAPPELSEYKMFKIPREQLRNVPEEFLQTHEPDVWSVDMRISWFADGGRVLQP